MITAVGGKFYAQNGKAMQFTRFVNKDGLVTSDGTVIQLLKSGSPITDLMHKITVSKSFEFCPQKPLKEINQSVRDALDEDVKLSVNQNRNTSSQNQSVTTYHLEPFGGGKIIFVWKNSKLHSEAMGIIQSGLNDDKIRLLNSMVVCRASKGTPVIVTDAGLTTHDILITGGPNTGCRGNIPAEELVKDK